LSGAPICLLIHAGEIIGCGQDPNAIAHLANLIKSQNQGQAIFLRGDCNPFFAWGKK
jgi:hypothetical protein